MASNGVNGKRKSRRWFWAQGDLGGVLVTVGRGSLDFRLSLKPEYRPG
ncbi:MAG: hypothetical protein U5J83_15720 [Bryobacterales bacterium]|nr:hypothetical protein [Bryobacterales bacterium]